MKNWNLYFNPPKSEKVTQINQYSIKGGLYNVKYTQCQYSPNYYDYGLFVSSGVVEHAYNFLPPHIEVS
jgi:hypothetical protein